MPKAINEEGIKCPFYIQMDYKTITCEGVTDDCSCVLKFNNHTAKNQHRKIFCSNKYENCEIYRMLEMKYEE